MRGGREGFIELQIERFNVLLGVKSWKTFNLSIWLVSD